MKKAILFLICFLSVYVARGQEPAPPTQEWCEWAFLQIPDHILLSEVDSAAFSADFYRLLKEVEELSVWEEEVCECRTDGNDLIYYWYDILFEESYFDKETTTVSFQYTSTTPETGEVLLTIHHPDIFADGSRDEYSRHTMYLLYENGAWRIDEWDNRREEFREYIKHARRLKYLLSFPDFQRICLDRPEKVQVYGLTVPQLKRQRRSADKTETLEHRHGLQRLQKLQCSGFDCLVL